MRTVPDRSVRPEFRIVAIPAALALGAIGAIAAERVHLPALLGFAGGAIAAVLAVLGLPSLPTRRAVIILIGIGGMGALRHASYAGSTRTSLLAIWAIATLITLILVDRADAETTPAMVRARALPALVPETVRVSAIIGVIVIVAAATLVPTVTDRLGRHVWPGVEPSFGDVQNAPTSLQATRSLDMTTRPRLSDKVVFTVDAPRADFWRGETYDVWDGQTWTRSDEDTRYLLDRDAANDVQVPPAAYDVGAVSGDEMRQTFHIESGYSNVVFAAPSPRVVQTDKLLRGRPDGTLAVAGNVSSGFGKGAVYTVVSRRLPSTEAELRAADRTPLPAEVRDRYAQPPSGTTERVRQLATDVTQNQPTTYDKVLALEAWIGANTKYSLNAPLSPQGVDVVDDFLFRSKLGWCEQIASSLVVLARNAGIPARLVTGFVPGERDPLTGRFVVREKHAHAWAEIFFPGIGWQGFDPTAKVPLAGDAKPGGSWLSAIRRHAVPLAIAAAVLTLLAGMYPELRRTLRRRRARRASWASRTFDRLERIGRKAGRARAPAETPMEYARVLAERLQAPELRDVAVALDADAFSADGASPEARERADAVLTSIRP